MKKFILFLMALVLFTACDRADIELGNSVKNSNINYSVEFAADVNAPLRMAINPSATTASSTDGLTWTVASYDQAWTSVNSNSYNTKVSLQPWEGAPSKMIVLSDPLASTDSYYEGISGGTFAINDGTIVATAEANGSYLKPMKVAFYGIHAAEISTVITGDTTGLSAANAYEGTANDFTIDYTLAWSNADHKALYAVAQFNPTFTVANNIKVKTTKTGAAKTVSRDLYPFTIQYIYVHSSSTVTLGNDYAHTFGADGCYKVGLPKGGVFSNGTTLKQVGAFKDYQFDSWTAANSPAFAVLGTNKSEVEVTLCCWNCGTRTIYLKDGKACTPGEWFYMQGTLKQGTTVSNPTNIDITAVTGVFMTDVCTAADIEITTLENAMSNVDPTITWTTSFTVDAVYGNMTGSYVEK